MNPGSDERMEIESKTKSELDKMVKYFNIKPTDIENRYIYLFGLEIPKTLDLTFLNAKKDLLKFVKKNKKQFIELVDEQLKIFKKLNSKLKISK